MNHSTIAGMLLLCATAPLASACMAEDPVTEDPASYIVPREETFEGKSYEVLASEWWQWVRAIPMEENPQLDAPCDVNQSGSVFFLGGTFGGAATRSCTVPADTALFFPLLNVGYSSCPEIVDGVEYTCAAVTSEEDLHSSAKALMESGEVALTLEIDGVAVPDLVGYRAHSEVFTDTAPPGPTELFGKCSGPIRENTCEVAVGSARKMVADGFWIMMRPLPSGEHELHFTGGLTFPDESMFSVELTYNLTVAP